MLMISNKYLVFFILCCLWWERRRGGQWLGALCDPSMFEILYWVLTFWNVQFNYGRRISLLSAIGFFLIILALCSNWVTVPMYLCLWLSLEVQIKWVSFIIHWSLNTTQCLLVTWSALDSFTIFIFSFELLILLIASCDVNCELSPCTPSDSF